MRSAAQVRHSDEEALLQRYGLPSNTNRDVLFRVLASLGVDAASRHEAPVAPRGSSGIQSTQQPSPRDLPTRRQQQQQQQEHDPRSEQHAEQHREEHEFERVVGAHLLPPAEDLSPLPLLYDGAVDAAQLLDLQSSLLERAASLRAAEVRCLKVQISCLLLTPRCVAG